MTEKAVDKGAERDGMRRKRGRVETEIWEGMEMMDGNGGKKRNDLGSNPFVVFVVVWVRCFRP